MINNDKSIKKMTKDKLRFAAKIRKQGNTRLIYVPKEVKEQATLGKLCLITELNLEELDNERISKNRE